MNKLDKISNKIMDKHVYACITRIGEYLFDWTGRAYATFYEWENIHEHYCKFCGEVCDYNSSFCPNCNRTLSENEMMVYEKELIEFWTISHKLADVLRAHGEAIWHLFDFYVWGRNGGEEKSSLDNIISKIAFEMCYEHKDYNLI